VLQRSSLAVLALSAFAKPLGALGVAKMAIELATYIYIYYVYIYSNINQTCIVFAAACHGAGCSWVEDIKKQERNKVVKTIDKLPIWEW